jgi:hypothetical protein
MQGNTESDDATDAQPATESTLVFGTDERYPTSPSELDAETVIETVHEGLVREFDQEVRER